MNSRTTILLIIGITCGFVFAFLIFGQSESLNLGKNGNSKNGIGSNYNFKKTIIDTSNTNHQMAMLASRISDLENQLDKYKDKSRQTETDEQNEDDELLTSEMKKQNPWLLTSKQKKERNQQRIERISTSLEVENVDVEWSLKTADLLKNTFDNIEFEGSTLNEVNCATSFCQITVNHDSQNAREDFESNPLLVPDMGMQALYIEGEKGRGQTVAFFIRKGYDSVSHPARLRDVDE